MKKLMKKLMSKAQKTMITTQAALSNCQGEFYVDKGVMVVLAVVLGLLLLAGMYSMYDDTIMPKLTEKITNLFNYSGT